MKPSHSGTPPQGNTPRVQTIALLTALAIVLAFAGSAIFGLRGSDAERQTEPAPAELEPVAPVATRGLVEVLNGAGTPGLARLATEHLRAAGFDVVQYGNARRTTDTSAVLDRVGRLDLATAVGRTLEISIVNTELDSTRMVDATVILGKDWAPLNPSENRDGKP